MSFLFRSSRAPAVEEPASTLRQRAARDQMRREIASEVEDREPLYDSNDWSVELLRLTSPEPLPRPEREYDPVDGSLVRPAERPRPWFAPTPQNHAVHGGRVDTHLDPKKEH